MAKISDVEVPSLLFDEQASDPATPGTGLARLYYKDDGKWWAINDAGTVVQVPTATGTPDGTKFLRDDGVWATPAGGGGGGDLTLIEEIRLAADGPIQFSSIPSSYGSLHLEGVVRGSAAVNSIGLAVRVGASTLDTGASAYHYYQRVQGSSQLDLQSNGASEARLGNVIGSTGVSNRFSSFSLDILDYATTGAERAFLCHSGVRPTSSTYLQSIAHGGWFNTTDAIDTVALGDVSSFGTNWLAGSAVRLYGMG